MEVYNCKVLLGGSRDNEVRKLAITAAEIVVLKHIHGDDSVLELVHVGSSKITNAQTRAMLTISYGGDDNSRAGPPVLKEVFGPPGAPLPQEIDGVKLRSKPVDIPIEKVIRWRAKADEEVVTHSDEPSFAD